MGLLDDLKEFDRPIWLFTKYDLELVPEDVLDKVDYIKCGRYLEDFKTDDNTQHGIKLATSNQNIFKTSELKRNVA